MDDIDYEGLAPEIAMYIKRIGDLRGNLKFGRAVQLCNLALEHDPEPLIKNVLLNFKADSLYRVGWKVQNTELIQEARSYFVEVLGLDPNDHVAQVGLEQIDFTN